MKLTSYSNYALRSLQLAALKAPDRIRVDDVVRVHGLARPHIVKIVARVGSGRVSGNSTRQRRWFLVGETGGTDQNRRCNSPDRRAPGCGRML